MMRSKTPTFCARAVGKKAQIRYIFTSSPRYIGAIAAADIAPRRPPPRRAYHTICATMVKFSAVEISIDSVMRASPMDSEVKRRMMEPAAPAANGTKDRTPVDLLCAAKTSSRHDNLDEK